MRVSVLSNCKADLNHVIGLIATSLVLGLTVSSSPAQDFIVPATISEEGRKAAASLVRKESNLPESDDIDGWRTAWLSNEETQEEEGQQVVETFDAAIKETKLGGVPVLDIRPKNWKDNGKVLIYTHGGAYTLFSPASTLTSSVPVADVTGLRLISVDYTVPPAAKWQQVTGEVVSVIKALLDEGYGLKDIAIYGDSAGGGLAAGSVLRARDEGVGLIGAVVLWSPWSDITETGDTYATLKDADPLLTYANSLKHAADAYADPKDQMHPYVSPVYGDYAKGFPPTLIQVGTKEIFLSNAVRHYQALDQAGIPVKLDPYEGMWHVFQAFHWQLPESDLARDKMGQFLREHLDF
jgi:monoterpene epsilon-lactone hydrolase